MRYFLMNGEKEIARFAITPGNFDDVYTLEDAGEEHLPIGFGNIGQWLEGRKAFRNNSALRPAMMACGCLAMTDGGIRTGRFLQVTHAASLNDAFWVKAQGEDIDWDRVSLYRNSFDLRVSESAFAGKWDGDLDYTPMALTPEFTTPGTYRKCWQQMDGTIWLCKGGGRRTWGREPYCEILGGELAGCLLGDSAAYALTKVNGEIASRCRIFTTERTGFVPIARFGVPQHSVDAMYRFYEALGCGEAYLRMLVTDALAVNVDRHGGNHGVLVENGTQRPLTMAPVFDMNRSKLADFGPKGPGDIGSEEQRLNRYAPAAGDDFIETARRVSARVPAIRRDLHRLAEFAFAFRGDEGFPEEWVQRAEELVRLRVRAILE